MESDQEVGRRIAKAREFLGLTQAAVAQRMGLARTTQVAVEQGQRTVSVNELQHYAEILGHPLEYFFAAGSWAEDDGFRAAFRQLAECLDAVHVGPPRPPGRPRGPLDPPPEKRALLAFEGLCRDALDLQRLNALAGPVLPHLPLPLKHSLHEAELLAAALRAPLDRGPEAALIDLRTALETAFGVLAFVLPDTGRLELAAFHHPELGACVLLSEDSPAALRLALARAFGHLLVAREQAFVSVAGAPTRGAAAGFARLFAGALLAPARGLRRRLAECQCELTDVLPTAIAWLAWHYGVDVELVRARLHSQRLMPRVLPAARPEPLHERPRPSLAAASEGDGVFRDPGWARLPQHFVFLAVQAFRRGAFDAARLAGYLGVSEELAHRQVLSFERGPL